jgi:lysophospholipase L1-like esterase
MRTLRHPALLALLAVLATAPGCATETDGRVGVAAQAVFTPPSLPGCLLWYDPTDLSTLFKDTAGTMPVTAGGDPIARANDKCTGNNGFQTGPSYHPSWAAGALNGQPGMAFDGASSVLVSQSAVPWGAFTMSMVLRSAPNQVTDATLFVDFNVALQIKVPAAPASMTTSVIDYFAQVGANRSEKLSTPAWMIDTPMVLTWRYGGAHATNQLYLNGTLVGAPAGPPAANPGTAFAATRAIFGGYGSGYLDWKGVLGDVVVYGSSLSDANRQQVEGWLMGKYGIATRSFGTPLNIVCDGNSIAAGTHIPGQEYPSQLGRLVAPYGWTVHNTGVGGQTTPWLDGSRAARVDPYLVPTGRKNVIVLNEILNDATTAPLPSTATILSRLGSYYTNAKAAGWNEVRLCTAQAAYAAGYSPAVMDAVNNALRAAGPGTYFDKLIDWGADDRIGVFPLPAGAVPLSATYWDDQQHPNGYGASIQAGMVAAGFIN